MEIYNQNAVQLVAAANEETDMAEELTFDFGGLRMEQIHPMDWGTASGVVVAVRGDERHDLTLSPWWDNDGSTGEFLSCSCGFRSRQFSGNGAWQAGHDGPPEEHKLDADHLAIRDAVADWERSQPRLDATPTEGDLAALLPVLAARVAADDGHKSDWDDDDDAVADWERSQPQGDTDHDHPDP